MTLPQQVLDYKADYTFTLDKKAGYAYTVKVTIGGQERPRNFVVKTMPALKAGENHTIEINF